MPKKSTKLAEYVFKQGFQIKPRLEPVDVFEAMGETQILEARVYDLYFEGKFIETYDKFEEAKEIGVRITSD